MTCSLFGSVCVRPNGIECTCGISTAGPICGVAIIKEHQKGKISRGAARSDRPCYLDTIICHFTFLLPPCGCYRLASPEPSLMLQLAVVHAWVSRNLYANSPHRKLSCIPFKLSSAIVCGWFNSISPCVRYHVFQCISTCRPEWSDKLSLRFNNVKWRQFRLAAW